MNYIISIQFKFTACKQSSVCVCFWTWRITALLKEHKQTEGCGWVIGNIWMSFWSFQSRNHEHITSYLAIWYTADELDKTNSWSKHPLLIAEENDMLNRRREKQTYQTTHFAVSYRHPQTDPIASWVSQESQWCVTLIDPNMPINISEPQHILSILLVFEMLTATDEWAKREINTKTKQWERGNLG